MENRCFHCKEHCCIGEFATFLTLRDALRIKKATGKDLEEFCTFGPISSDPQEQTWLMEDKEHTYFDFTDSGKVLQLKCNEKFECIFLGDKKQCIIYQSRPMICQVFPIWYYQDPDRKIELVIDPDASDECWLCERMTIKRICQKLGTDKISMYKKMKKFVKEINEYKEYEHYFLEGMKPSEVIKKLSTPK